MNKWLILAILTALAFFVWTLPVPAKADHHIAVGYIAKSNHYLSDGQTCDDGEKVDWHEDNNGFYVKWDGWLAGTYESSHATCPEDKERIWVVGREFSLNRGKNWEFSHTWAVATYDKPRLWLTLNGQYGYFKTWATYDVVAFGLEYEF